MKGYSDEKKVDEDRRLHSPELHAVLKGVHKRQTLAQLPSSGDLTFLSNKYCEYFIYFNNTIGIKFVLLRECLPV